MKYPRDSTLLSPKFSGFLPHIKFLVEMNIMKQNFEGVIVTIKDDMKTLSNEKLIDGNDYHNNSIHKAISESASRF